MGQMRKPGSKILLCFVTGIVAGMLMGAATISVVVSYRMDQFYERIAYLENTIKDRDAKLEALEKSVNTRKIVLKDIEVVLNFEGDEIDKIKIEKAVREKYALLLGKEVKSMDGDMIVQVVDNRIMMTEKGQHKLKVERLVLTEILKIWILAKSLD